MKRMLSIVDAISHWTGSIVAFLIPAMMLIGAKEIYALYSTRVSGSAWTNPTSS